MPISNIDIRFKVLELLYADTYGETYRILIGKKRSGSGFMSPGDMRDSNGNSSKGNNSEISDEEKEEEKEGKA